MQEAYISLRLIFPRDIAGEIIRWRGKLDMQEELTEWKEGFAKIPPKSYGYFRMSQCKDDTSRMTEGTYKGCLFEIAMNIQRRSGYFVILRRRPKIYN